MNKPIDSYSSIPAAFAAAVQANPQANIFSQAQLQQGRSGPRTWVNFTFSEVARRAAALANFLRSHGVQKGDRVAILSNSRPEWMVADLAILSLGCVSVSIYQSLTAAEVAFILEDSGSQVVIAENQEQVDKLLKIAGETLELPATETRAAGAFRVPIQKIVTFEAVDAHPLVVPLGSIANEDPTAVYTVENSLSPGSLASLVYTSGTTGAPKGVMQTHGNHLANVRQAYEGGLWRENSVIMVFLPLAHSFAKLMGYIGCLGGVLLRFPAIVDPRSSRLDAETVTRDIAAADATLVPAVPRILEKMQDALTARCHSPGIVNRAVALGVRTAVAIYEAERSGTPLALRNKLLAPFARLIGDIVKRALFGSRLVAVVSGGAKLDSTVNHFFQALGIPVLQGYGLTETCVATNVNRLERNRIGTVGPVLADDIEMRIEADGEICFRGPNITQGYWNRSTATAASWDAEGWFHTGDLGSIDGDGFLSVNGRKKELIVTSGGKKIPPDPIESALKQSPWITQAVLVGEGRSYCCVLLVLNRSVLSAKFPKEKIGSEPLDQQQNIRVLVQQELDRVNSGLASYESVKRFAILPDEFSLENGLLTPTFKVKRSEVERRYATVIDAMYAAKREG